MKHSSDDSKKPCEQITKNATITPKATIMLFISSRNQVITRIVGCLLCFALATCGDRYPEQTKLSASFVIWTSSPGTSFLVHGNEDKGTIILGPHIQSWQKCGHLIVGEVIHHSGTNPDLSTQPEDSGYFILDLKTEKLMKGLQKSQFDQKLRTLGVSL
jgi:hypothetical protein